MLALVREKLFSWMPACASSSTCEFRIAGNLQILDVREFRPPGCATRRIEYRIEHIKLPIVRPIDILIPFPYACSFGIFPPPAMPSPHTR